MWFVDVLLPSFTAQVQSVRRPVNDPVCSYPHSQLKDSLLLRSQLRVSRSSLNFLKLGAR